MNTLSRLILPIIAAFLSMTSSAYAQSASSDKGEMAVDVDVDALVNTSPGEQEDIFAALNLPEGYVIPNGPKEEEGRIALAKLNAAERQRFDKVRLKFLGRASRFARFFHAPRFIHNGFVSFLSEQLHASAHVIASPVRKGLRLRLHIGGGIGVHGWLSKIATKIVNPNLDFKGTFFVAAGGMAVLLENGDQGRKVIFDFFMDYERLKAIHTAASQVEAVANLAVVFESDEMIDTEPRLQQRQMLGLHRGILGILRRDSSTFEWGKGMAVSLPPFVPSVSMVDTDVKRWRLRVVFPFDLQSLQSWVPWLHAKNSSDSVYRSLQCQKVF